MKRRAVLILLLLVGGAIVNVVVAWVFVGRSSGEPLTGRENALYGSDYAWWKRSKPEHFFDVDLQQLVVTRETAAFRVAYVQSRNAISVDETGSARVMEFADHIDAGWPAPALTGTRWFQLRDGRLSFDLSDWSIVPNRNSTVHTVVLPFRPIWPGFAINTIFYAAVLWLLFAVPLALRKRRRIKCGLCPKCAYDLRGIKRDPHPGPLSKGKGVPVCPECGTAITH